MKIAIFTDTFYPTTNWIVTSTITFCKELADNWNEIIIITPNNKWIEEFKYKNIELFTIKWIPAFFYPDFKLTFWFTPNLINKIKDFNPEIIHFHTQFIIWWHAIIIWKMFKIPVVWTFHTYIADECYLKIIWLKSKIFWKIWWKYNNFFYKKIDKVIVPSQNAFDELVNHWIEKNKIELLSNPLPQVNFWENKKNKYLDKIKTKNIALYVWRLSKEKNVNICIEAIYLVTKEISNILFVIVWDWPEKLELLKLVKKYNLEENVLFLWKIKHEDLLNSDIYDKTKLFLSASPSETQWITLLEAMHFSLPVVWVSEKWVWELIKDNWFKAENENSWELAIYILKLLKNEKLRKIMWQKSKEMLKDFDSKKLTKKLEKIYKNTILEYKK